MYDVYISNEDNQKPVSLWLEISLLYFKFIGFSSNWLNINLLLVFNLFIFLSLSKIINIFFYFFF